MELTLDNFRLWIEHEFSLANAGGTSADFSVRKTAVLRYETLQAAQKALLEFTQERRTPP
jgi:hypothetical protein